jgi:hypothetical protein
MALGGDLELREYARPKRIEMRLEDRDAYRIYPVQALRAAVLIVDEPGTPEHLQMLGDCRPTDRKAFGQPCYREWSIGQAAQDGESRRIA